MATDNFTIRVFTPQGLVLEDISSGVKLPAADGEIGVLPEHAKYVGLLGTGILEYQSHPGNEVKRVALAEGICLYAEDELTVLADRVATLESIDLLSFMDRREELTTFVAAGSLEDPERLTACKELAFIEAVEKLVHQ